MKKFLRFFIAMILSIFVYYNCSDNPASSDNNQGGPYCGQTPPGMTPKIFAPGIIPESAFSITFTPDGTECFYTEWVTTNTIFTTKLVGGSWTEPQVASFSGMPMDMEPHMTPDGNRVYFGSMRPLDGASTEILHTWFADRTGTGWSEAQPINPPLRELSMMYPSVASNGNLYYTSVQSGDQYISVSRYVNGNYQEPERLGNSINSRQSSGHPFIAPDESYLIYDAVTKVENNIYYRDLFISFNNNGTWSESISLGNAINTDGVEMCAFVSRDDKYLFFSRWVEATGISNIYWVDAGIIENYR